MNKWIKRTSMSAGVIAINHQTLSNKVAAGCFAPPLWLDKRNRRTGKKTQVKLSLGVWR